MKRFSVLLCSSKTVSVLIIAKIEAWHVTFGVGGSTGVLYRIDGRWLVGNAMAPLDGGVDI